MNNISGNAAGSDSSVFTAAVEYIQSQLEQEKLMRTEANEPRIAEVLFFGGTYDSLWSPDEYAPTDDQGDAIDSGSVKSFKGYLDHLGECYVEGLVSELEIPDGMVSFESTSSPREYNFGTDRLFVNVDQAWLTGIVESIYGDADMREAFEEYLAAHFTSCDGFCSSYSNSIEEWKRDFIQDGIGNSDHNICGTYLSFWMKWQHKEFGSGESLEVDLHYSIYVALGNYVQDNWEYEYSTILDALTELVVVEGSVTIDCPGQLALPL